MRAAAAWEARRDGGALMEGNEMDAAAPSAAAAEIAHLIDAFFRAVSFTPGAKPGYADLHSLFIGAALLIKNVGPTPEICTVDAFIHPRQCMVDAGQLTQFHEAEIAAVTEVFGNVAHRFSSYAKSGTMNGIPFQARGMISTQFIHTPSGWRISAMAWDDERPGLALPASFDRGAKT